MHLPQLCCTGLSTAAQPVPAGRPGSCSHSLQAQLDPCKHACMHAPSDPLCMPAGSGFGEPLGSRSRSNSLPARASGGSLQARGSGSSHGAGAQPQPASAPLAEGPGPGQPPLSDSGPVRSMGPAPSSGALRSVLQLAHAIPRVAAAGRIQLPPGLLSEPAVSKPSDAVARPQGIASTKHQQLVALCLPAGEAFACISWLVCLSHACHNSSV